MFRASVIPTTTELIKEVNSILYHFIWNGKDKVKHHALISDIEMGGLKMLDIDSMIRAKWIICLKNFFEDYQSTWKTILDKLLSPVGGRFVLHCNFHTSKLKISFPLNITRNALMRGQIQTGKRHVVIEKFSMSLSGIINFSVTTKNQCTEGT